ncbi:apolipoprotein N-acyltransferase [Idiomarina seosinensis]|uniref:apolipoprotein N-acyltransferase n=1 Tax=Idiomarina seosinensis TaxID=281739 RepID=UPI00384F6AB7
MITAVKHQLQQRSWLRQLLLLVLGGCLCFAYAPFELTLLPFVILPLLLAISWNLGVKQAFAAGFSFALGWFGVGLSWIYVSIDQYGGMPAVANVAVMLLLVAYLSCFPALALALWRWLCQRSELWRFSLPLIWLTTEALRGWLFSGFPWLGLGYTQTETLLGGLASSVGQYGITVVLWFIALAIVTGLRYRRPQNALLLVIIISLAWLAPGLQPLQRSGETTSVLLVQGNVQQSLKWQSDQQWPNILRYLDLTRPNYQHDIIIWPESAITALEPYADDILHNIDQAASINNAAVVTGIIDYDQQQDEFYNSVIVLGQQTANDDFMPAYRYGHDNRYQKHQLLPIGEFVPFEELLRPLAPLFNLPMSSFNRGAYQQANLQAKGQRLSTAICYEIAFSGQVRDNTTADTDFILTVSNDTWFGDSHGPWQHMQIAQMRARELGRPVLRATNNGVSAVTDEHGSIIAIAPQFTATTVSAEVANVRGSTLFAQAGQWPAIATALLGLLPLLRRLANRRGQLQQKSVQ